MGTVFILNLYGSDSGVLQSGAAEALMEVRRLDEMLSNYIPGSELSSVNDRAADAPVFVSRELFDLISDCLNYSRESEGTFDITVGPLMKLWGFYKGSGTLPSSTEIRSTLEVIGYQNIELNAADRTICFRKRGLNLDPGGIGKGYALDKIAASLRNSGICSALISAGGSSLYAVGAPPDSSEGWLIAIREPEGHDEAGSQIFLKDASLSTSGSLEKFFWAGGKRYSHIMDPRTGFPSQGMVSTSVIAPRAVESEVWAKPYYILGRAWTERHKPPQFRVLMCEDDRTEPCKWLD